jgi:hypothetical protein
VAGRLALRRAGNHTKGLIDRHPVNKLGKRIQKRMLAAVNGKTELFLTNAPTGHRGPQSIVKIEGITDQSPSKDTRAQVSLDVAWQSLTLKEVEVWSSGDGLELAGRGQTLPGNRPMAARSNQGHSQDRYGFHATFPRTSPVVLGLRGDCGELLEIEVAF